MKRYTDTEIFISSDNLDDLDILFDIVCTLVKNHAILLTTERSKRMWRAGETGTAIDNDGRIVPGAGDDQVYPEGESLAERLTFRGDEQLDYRNTTGIDLQRIQEAYLTLCRQEK